MKPNYIFKESTIFIGYRFIEVCNYKSNNSIKFFYWRRKDNCGGQFSVGIWKFKKIK